uniref:Uncharacterized protein n=1 Tax=Dulem virus 33 TaxID=3145751 RepID=A0AAU8B5P8_9CAUD
MLEQVLTYLNNWFLMDIYEGTYTIQDGSITLPFLQNGQYFRVIGSVFNDGLYQYNDELSLTDEVFDGVIWALAVPGTVAQIAAEMAAWEAKNGAAASGPYQSESFGGYSYSKASGSSASGVMTVFDAFSSRLNAYKKPRELGYVQPSRLPTPTYKRPFNPDFPWR